MKIGIFSESYEPVLNGVTVSILTLTRELKKLGHDIYVFAPNYPGHKDVENVTFRFPSVRTWFARDYPLAWPYMPGLTRKVKQLGLDVIHTHTPFMTGWAGLKLARRLGIPIVSTNHTQYVEYAHYVPLAPRATMRAIIIGHLRRYYNKCDGVVVPSSPTADLLRTYGVLKPIYVIPTGNTLDTCMDPQARSTIRQEYGIPADARALIYVGRLAREKNLGLLFNAFEKLAAGCEGLYLLVVGGGPFEAGCREIAARLAYSGRVKFTGYIPREKVAKYYSAGDIFAFPSMTETQGLVIGEALGAGLPCVAVNAGGAPEMVVDGADSFLAANDAEDFSSKIARFLTDRELYRRFSCKAVENAARFTPHGMAARMLEVYETVIRSRVLLT